METRQLLLFYACKNSDLFIPTLDGIAVSAQCLSLESVVPHARLNEHIPYIN